MSNRSLPDTLFKYVPFDSKEPEIQKRNQKHLRAVIQNGMLWFSSASALNDPFECQIKFNWNARPEIKRQYVREKLQALDRPSDDESIMRTIKAWEAHEEGDTEAGFRKMINNQMALFSAAEDWSNLLMWSHYTKDHQGVCIGFETHLLANSLGLQFFEVNYRNRPPIVRAYRPTTEQNLSVALCKSKIWSYEKEWRMVIPESGSFSREFDRSAIQTVIFGLKTKDSSISKISKWCRRGGMSPALFRAEQNPVDYSISKRTLPIHLPRHKA